MVFGWGRKSLIGLAGGLLLAAPSLAATAQNAAPAAAPQAQGEPRPAIWLLSDADTRIYLFGTVHLLHPDLRWRSPAFDRIAREAQELVLEVTDEQIEENSDDFAMTRLPSPVPVLQRVSPDRREGFARMLRDLGVAEGSLDSLQTWAVAISLGVAQISQDYAGTQGDSQAAAAEVPSVEAVLTAQFRANGREVYGVETPADQIDAFRAMPAAVQQLMLDETVDAYITGEEPGDPDESAWVNGDLDGIAADMEGLPPELYETLITRRNRGFADFLAQRLNRPGTVLFAVGAGHLAGRVSVQSMLESRGLRVQRIY